MSKNFIQKGLFVLATLLLFVSSENVASATSTTWGTPAPLPLPAYNNYGFDFAKGGALATASVTGGGNSVGLTIFNTTVTPYTTTVINAADFPVGNTCGAMAVTGSELTNGKFYLGSSCTGTGTGLMQFSYGTNLAPTLLVAIPGTNKNLYGIGLSPDETTAYATTKSGTIAVIGGLNATPTLTEHSMPQAADNGTGVIVSSDGKRVYFTASTPTSARGIWEFNLTDPANPQFTQILNTGNNAVTGLATDSSRTNIYASSGNGIYKISLANTSNQSFVTTPQSTVNRTVNISPDGTSLWAITGATLAVANQYQPDLSSGTAAQSITGNFSSFSGSGYSRFNKEGTMLAVVISSGSPTVVNNIQFLINPTNPLPAPTASPSPTPSPSNTSEDLAKTGFTSSQFALPFGLALGAGLLGLLLVVIRKRLRK